MQCRSKTVPAALLGVMAAAVVAPALAVPAVAAPVGGGVGASTGGVGRGPAPLGKNVVLVEVNNDKIMASDVDRIIDSFKAQEPALAGETPNAIAAIKDMRKQVIDNLISHSLLYQDAMAHNITPTKKDVDAAVAEFKRSFVDDDAFRKSLANEGKTQADLERLVTQELAIRELTKQLSSDIVVSEDDMAAYYKANIQKFGAPESVRARHILFAVPEKASAADRQKAKSRAADMLRKLQAGADFTKMAKQFSEDPTAKDNGGDLGWFGRGEMAKAFEDAVFNTPPGKLIGPVQTPYGYHIIKVEEHQQPRTLALNEVKDLIKPILLKQKVKERLDQRLTELRAKAVIKQYG